MAPQPFQRDWPLWAILGFDAAFTGLAWGEVFEQRLWDIPTTQEARAWMLLLLLGYVIVANWVFFLWRAEKPRKLSGAVVRLVLLVVFLIVHSAFLLPKAGLLAGIR